MSQLPFSYIRKTELQKTLGGLSRSKIEALVAEGVLPKPYRLGKRTIAWRSDELENALAAMPRIDNAYERAEAARKEKHR